MNILLLGSGGREHALAWKIAQSNKCDILYIAPGNAGTDGVGGKGKNVNIKADDFETIKSFVLENNVKMVVVGPEDPLVKGIYDDFKSDARTDLFLNWGYILIILGIVIALISVVFTAAVKGVKGKKGCADIANPRGGKERTQGDAGWHVWQCVFKSGHRGIPQWHRMFCLCNY